jgi:5-methylcytosine-specific restriction endonuclease McrA
MASRVPCAGTCGQLIYHTKASLPVGQATCRKCRNTAPKPYGSKKQAVSLPEPRTCPVCEKLWQPTAKSKTRYCSTVCVNVSRGSVGVLQGDRARYAAKLARRRAAIVSQTIETVDPETVYARDKWVCQLCNRRVNPAIRGVSRWAPSLDHVIPVSKGGAHSYANVQLAHFGCNSAKQAQVTI